MPNRTQQKAPHPSEDIASRQNPQQIDVEQLSSEELQELEAFELGDEEFISEPSDLTDPAFDKQTNLNYNSVADAQSLSEAESQERSVPHPTLKHEQHDQPAERWVRGSARDAAMQITSNLETRRSNEDASDQSFLSHHNFDARSSANPEQHQFCHAEDLQRKSSRSDLRQYNARTPLSSLKEVRNETENGDSTEVDQPSGGTDHVQNSNGGPPFNAADPQFVRPMEHRFNQARFEQNPANNPASADSVTAGAKDPLFKPALGGSELLRRLWRRLRFAAALLLAAGFGLAGFMAGQSNNPAEGWIGIDALLGTDTSYQIEPSQLLHLQNDFVESSSPGLAETEPQTEAFGKSIAIDETPANAVGAPLIIAFNSLNSDPQFTEFPDSELREWDAFFAEFEQPNPRAMVDNGVTEIDAPPPMEIRMRNTGEDTESSIAVRTSDTAEVETEPQFSELARAKLRQGASEHTPAAGISPDDTRTDTVPLGKSEQPKPATNSVAHTSAPQPDSKSENAIKTLVERLETIENRITKLEASPTQNSIAYALSADTDTPLLWSNDSSIEPEPTVDQAMAAKAVLEGSNAYALQSGTLFNASVRLREARVGDAVDGYGKVIEIQKYPNGGRMVIFENGSVYLH